MKAIAFGRIGVDILINTEEEFRTSEQLAGTSYTFSLGGRGANQAVNLCRLGIDTYLVGHLGNDGVGQELLTFLKSARVRTDGIRIVGSCSGLVIHGIDYNRSHRTLAVVDGANSKMDDDDLRLFITNMNGAIVALLQILHPWPIVIRAAQVAKNAGITTILDPAPLVSEIPDELYSFIDVITPNQQEAETLVGFPVGDIIAAKAAAELLRQRGIPVAIIKLGNQGALYSSASVTVHLPPLDVSIEDTIGAGDAFNSGMAAGLCYGNSSLLASVWGIAASAISISGRGSVSAQLDMSRLSKWIDQYRSQNLSLFGVIRETETYYS